MKKGAIALIVIAGVICGLILQAVLGWALLPQLEDEDGRIVFKGSEYHFNDEFRSREAGDYVGKTTYCRVREIKNDPDHVFLYLQKKWYQDMDYVLLARTDAAEAFCGNIESLYAYTANGNERIETSDPAVINAFIEARFANDTMPAARTTWVKSCAITAVNPEFPSVIMRFGAVKNEKTWYLLRGGEYCALPQAAADWLEYNSLGV